MAVIEERGVSFIVYGVPMPKGSHTAVVRGNRAVLLDARRGPSRKAFEVWTMAVYTAAHVRTVPLMDATPSGPYALDGPLNVCARFFFPRPKTETRAERLRLFKTTTPDLDKLLRALLDPMTKAGLIADDARVVSFNGSAKLFVPWVPYVGGGIDWSRPRVEVTVTRLQETL